LKVIIAAPVIAILVLILAILLVSRWAFGEEFPAIAKLLAYGVLVGGVAGLIVAVTGLLRELRSRATS
jgi:preprotein translocase subunit Sss1